MLRTIVALALMSAVAEAAPAQCTPLSTDIVSLGERSARFYAERSLNRQIEEEKALMRRQGMEVGKVTPPALECKFFPNIINMDEWRCTGSARVCTKGDALNPRGPKRPSAGGASLLRRTPPAANRKPAAPAPTAR